MRSQFALLILAVLFAFQIYAGMMGLVHINRSVMESLRLSGMSAGFLVIAAAYIVLIERRREHARAEQTRWLDELEREEADSAEQPRTGRE